MPIKPRKQAIPTEEVKEYRVKICWFTPEFMAMAMQDDNEIHVKVKDGCPDDANVVGQGYDPSRRLFFLHIEHESFEPIKNGQPLPTLEPTLLSVS